MQFRTFDLTPADKYRKRAPGKRRGEERGGEGRGEEERGGEERGGEGRGEEERGAEEWVEQGKEEEKVEEVRKIEKTEVGLLKEGEEEREKDGGREREGEGGVVETVPAQVGTSQERREEDVFEKRTDSLLAILQDRPLELQVI